jgi:hypothetical protein
MIDILKNLKKVIYEDESDELIKQFKKIGAAKRRNAKLVVDNKKYNNIQIFDEKASPIMGFVEKIKKSDANTSIDININKTIKQYQAFDSDNNYVIKKKYVNEAIELAHKKYKILDLLEDKKINIFITNKGREDFKSYLYNDWKNENFEIFIYSAEDAIYTLLRQFGIIISSKEFYKSK